MSLDDDLAPLFRACTPATPSLRDVAGQACIKLCQGDTGRARTLWKVVVDDLGYMPHAAAQTLVRASETLNLVPDVEAPEPS